MLYHSSTGRQIEAEIHALSFFELGRFWTLSEGIEYEPIPGFEDGQYVCRTMHGWGWWGRSVLGCIFDEQKMSIFPQELPSCNSMERCPSCNAVRQTNSSHKALEGTTISPVSSTPSQQLCLLWPYQRAWKEAVEWLLSVVWSLDEVLWSRHLCWVDWICGRGRGREGWRERQRERGAGVLDSWRAVGLES